MSTQSRFPFAAFPTGWFRAAGSDELPPGQLLSLRLFGQDVVLLRTAGGRLHMLEAYCPHLGAHLGHGGKVEGEQVVCPFHGWRFTAADGSLAEVPYATGPIPRRCLRTWPLREQDGQILAWNHAEGAPPSWEPPTVPEASDPAWTPLRLTQRWRIRTHIQEFAENGVDNAHFSWLHSQQTLGMETRGLQPDGPRLVHRTWQRFNLFGLARFLVDKVEGPLDINYHGLGIYVNRATVHTGIDLHYTFVFYAVPVDEDEVELVSLLTMRRLSFPLATHLLWRKAAAEGAVTINQDVPIWENKRYVRRPVLVPEDGPLHAFRAWAAQFYPAAALQEATP